MDRDPNAIYIVLEESDFLTYTDGNLRVESPQSGAQEYTDIISLEVENPLGIRRYFRIAPGEFNGLGRQILVLASYCGGYTSDYTFA